MIFPSKNNNLYCNSCLEKRPKTTENSVWNSLYREVYGENPFNKVLQKMCIYSSRILSGWCFWINPESRAERTWTHFRSSWTRQRIRASRTKIRHTNSSYERSFIPARKNQFYAYLTQGSTVVSDHFSDHSRLDERLEPVDGQWIPGLTNNALFDRYLQDYGRLGDLAKVFKNTS